MSRSCSLFGFLILVGSFLPTAGVRAQEAIADSLEAVGARIEALIPRVEEADRAADLAERNRSDSVRAANQVPQDTVMIGPFMVVTPDGQTELAKEALSPHIGEVLPWIRGSEELLRDHAWAYQYGWFSEPIFLDSVTVHNVTIHRRYSRARSRTWIRTALGEALHDALPAEDPELRDLASPSNLLPTDDWGWVYRALASAPNLSAEECLDGDLAWCWEALGLAEPIASDPVWASPDQRRRLVRSRYERFLWMSPDRMGTRENLLWGCLVLEEDRGCDLILEGYHLREGYAGRGYPLTLSGNARASIVGEALRMGGIGSFTRLTANPDEPLRNRLAHAAGIPPEELVALWREKVLAGRPNAQAGLLRTPFPLVFWILLMIAFALRSSRWRLG